MMVKERVEAHDENTQNDFDCMLTFPEYDEVMTGLCHKQLVRIDCAFKEGQIQTACYSTAVKLALP